MKVRLLITCGLMALASALFSSCVEKQDPGLDIVSSLKDVSRLELARMTIGKVGMISDHKYEDAKTVSEKAKALVDAMKIGNRVGVYSYDTYLTAYIDLSSLTPDDVTFEEKDNVVRVTLPPVEIVTDGRDPVLKEEHYRVTGLRSSITPQERARLKAQMAVEVKKEIAGDEGSRRLLREDAEKKALAWFSGIIESRGYVADVRFR